MAIPGRNPDREDSLTVPESPSATSISSADDQSITDSFGVAWRISPSGHAVRNGVVDPSEPVLQLSYVNHCLWRQTRDLQWSPWAHPTSLWFGRTPRSPLPGPDNRIIEQIQRSVGEVLTGLSAFKSAFDVFKAQPPASVTPILVALTAFRQDIDAREDALSTLVLTQFAGLRTTIATGFLDLKTQADSRQTVLVNDLAALFNTEAQTDAANQATVVALLTQIVLLLKQQSAPTKISLDLAGATHKPQAIPPAAGP